MTKDDKKLVRQRLHVLELAEKMGNVSEACRRCGISRSRFYEYKKRFETQGIEGLKNLPPVHKTHPQTTTPKVVEEILKLSLENPMWGCRRLSKQLKSRGISVSGPTIQKILNRKGLGSRYQRLSKSKAIPYGETVGEEA